MEKLILEHARVLIYGIGGNGLHLSERIRDYCQIEGFIDKRAHEIGKSKNGLKVYTISEAAEHCLNKDMYVIFITVKNVFVHSEIARQLLDSGFHRIVYKPSSILKGNANDNERAVDRIYETLIERKEYLFGFEIPYTNSIRIALKDRLYIDMMDNIVTAWCPIELLFNYKETNDYPGLNMPLFFPMVELYKFFLGDKLITEEEAISNYIVYCCEWLNINQDDLTEAQKNSFVESRVAVFQEMQKMAEADIEFFKRNCPQVNYDEGRFYLTSSGRNRVSFLIAKGFKYIPVKMSRFDYEKWCNLESVKKMEEYITENNISSFFAPFPNPYLVDFSFDFVDYQRLFLFPIANIILKQIYKKNRKKKGTLVITDFEGVEKDKQNVEVVCALKDDGIAERYFESIGVSTRIQRNSGQKFLVIDSMFQGDKVILERNYAFIFYLDREKKYLDKKSLTERGYKQTDSLFNIMMKHGRIGASMYEREQ